VSAHGNNVYICIMNKNVTIDDVAKLAGVSKGTIDRVVHNRGEVSEKTANKVRKAIEELGYEPNLHAALLATKTERKIACIVQASRKDEYWGKILTGLYEGSDAVEFMNLKIEEFLFDLNDVASFEQACLNAIESQPAGIILAPLFKSKSIAFVSEFQKRNIPYIYIDTKLEDSNCLAYLGMQKYQSGYMCASLLTGKTRQEELDRVLLVRVERDKARQSDPTAERREGFYDYMSEHYPQCNVENVFVDSSEPDKIVKTLEEYFKDNGDIKHIAMLNSRIFLIGDFLKRHPDPERIVVGFDSLDRNLELVRTGSVDIIITEHIELMAKKSVEIMADYLIRYKRPDERDNYQHMDILTALNLGYY